MLLARPVAPAAVPLVVLVRDTPEAAAVVAQR
jgi:hypothetical protein